MDLRQSFENIMKYIDTQKEESLDDLVKVRDFLILSERKRKDIDKEYVKRMIYYLGLTIATIEKKRAEDLCVKLKLWREKIYHT